VRPPSGDTCWSGHLEWSCPARARDLSQQRRVMAGADEVILNTVEETNLWIDSPVDSQMVDDVVCQS